jgi:SAM-dependent methyltransferase
VSSRQRLAFDPVGEDYERGRAGWPAEVVQGVAGDTAVDLAAGTGKLTRLLVQRFARVVAVEPGEGMRAVLAREVPEAEQIAGSAEAIPLSDRSVDAVLVAEAFHWFDSVDAAREIARVLRPGGTCVVCFNLWRSSFKPTLPSAARALLDEAFARTGEPGGTKVASGEWKAGFAVAPFGPLEESNVDHEFVCDREGVVAYLPLDQQCRAAFPGRPRTASPRALRGAAGHGLPARPDRESLAGGSPSRL